MAEKRTAPKHMRRDNSSVKVAAPAKRDQAPAGPAALVFVVAFFVVVLIPLVCMPFVREDVSAEKRELAPAPELMKEDGPNLNILSDTGDYFADHFAFRGTLVDLDATLKQRLLMTSSTSNVVVGSSGWLYYAGTLNDFQRRNHMTDHELLNIANNLALIQEYVMAQGKGFAVAIAPNKNSLYPEHMPYYEIEGEGERNLERLMPLLAAKGVRACDLQTTIAAQDDVLYYKRDSHWNGAGALLVYRTIAPLLATPVPLFEGAEQSITGHVGDVDAMLHPQTAQPEDDPHWVAADAWSFSNEATSVEDDKVQTTSSMPGATGSLVMYRDSFGNNLLPYFAAAYGQATFSKLVPYDMSHSAIAAANDVVVERAERHVDLFATNPPYLPSPERAAMPEGEPQQDGASVHLSTNGPYLVVEGTIDEACAAAEDRIFVEVTGVDGSAHVLEAFHVSEESAGTQDFEGAEDAQEEPTIRGDWGYRAFATMGGQGASSSTRVRVLVGDAQGVHELARVAVGA
ncbi:MAG: hypothetical protein IKF14_10430 [Atopobiaceae bacterium]|nr:hypothetical protein [Atopobiaceae bacterium]